MASISAPQSLDNSMRQHGGAHLDRPDKFEREQFSISDLTTEFDCTARALRFYEDEGLISPSRVGLTRVYSKRDRARLAWIMRAKNVRSEEHTSELQSLMRISYAVFCLKKKIYHQSQYYNTRYIDNSLHLSATEVI